MMFCAECRDEVAPQVVRRDEIYQVRGEEIPVLCHVAVCPVCKNDIVDESLEERNLELAFGEYRRHHNLLRPEEIRTIRERYGLSQRTLARVLGWGDITIHRYETGALQDNAHEEVLRLIADPKNMRAVVARNADALAPDVSHRLSERIEELASGSAEQEYQTILELVMSSGAPSLANGFRRLDLGNLQEMVLYFAATVQNAFKTKLNKLLWYSDFYNYSNTARSISGATYMAATHGPVPKQYALLLGDMERRELIQLEEIEFDSGASGEMVRRLREFMPAGFSDDELSSMKHVADTFRDETSKQVRDLSHEEHAYKETFKEGCEWQEIPYSLSDTLSI